MFVLYAFLVAIFLAGVGIFFIQTFQLEGYKIKNYIKKAIKFNFAKCDKNKIIFTKRVKRLIFFDFFVNFCLFLIIFCFLYNIFSLIFVFIFIIFRPILIVLSFLIERPIEEIVKHFYIKKAKKKLKQSRCKKIAITGSFGKTTTKNILYQILSEEFSVCATPKSFNTPMGVCKSVLENLKETDDFFIAEFGARHPGDIKFLADFVDVDFSIITPIGNCHLESFKTIETIENTKYELCENTKNFVVFNAQSKSTKKLYNRFERKKYLVCEKNSFAFARNIFSNSCGSSFDMVLDGKAFHCDCKLLGRANIDNIVVASAMAYLLGVTPYGIISGIKKIKPIPHRLELIQTEISTIIDDSYNSNFEGFCQALEVLKNFDGRKIIVTPGVVELGKEQFANNFRLAEKMKDVADIVVIMNKTNKDALRQGCLGTETYFANTRQEQKKILKEIIRPGDVILFENDLPDNFK